MKWFLQPNVSGVILFLGYFFLYGLEYIIPLTRKKSSHFWTNVMMAIVLITVNAIFASATLAVSEWVTHSKVGLFHYISLGIGWQILISIVLLDFWAGYVVHVILHKHPLLWRLHTVHHSDDFVDVTTTFRQHPAESVIRIFFNLSGMVLLGIPSWMLLLYLVLSTINAQIEHANIRLPDKLDRILQYIIVTPNMHKVHHSKYQHETDSNYSNIFSIWDRLFNTYTSKHNYTTISYGLDFLNNNTHYTFWDLVRLRFKYFKTNKIEKPNSADR
jgi:sterol desaturase/sphingolipid hydroxylase (fatty acid hydroxylase superfamily)